MTSTVLTFNYFLYLMVPFAFLIGSIPFGIIFTKNTGIDIRSTGSRNIGATNVLRSAGKTPAVLTLLGDLLKGAAAVLICKFIIAKTNISPEAADHAVIIDDFWSGIIGISAVLGHMFSIFLSFRGGKGVATGFGVLLIYSPAVAGISLAVWILTALIFKYSSLAAIVSVFTIPFMFFIINSSAIKIIISVLLAALIIYKHKSNISNLLSGDESKIGDK